MGKKKLFPKREKLRKAPAHHIGKEHGTVKFHTAKRQSGGVRHGRGLLSCQCKILVKNRQTAHCVIFLILPCPARAVKARTPRKNRPAAPAFLGTLPNPGRPNTSAAQGMRSCRRKAPAAPAYAHKRKPPPAQGRRRFYC